MNTDLRITIYTAELLADLRAEGWRASDVLPGSSGHIRHQWADICEPGNLQTVARAMTLAWAEATAIHPLTDCTPPAYTDTPPDRGPDSVTPENGEVPDGPDDRLRLPDKFMCLARLSSRAATAVLLRLHDFLVNAVLYAFSLTLPGGDTALWHRRREDSLSALKALLASPPSDEEPPGTDALAFRRPVPLI